MSLSFSTMARKVVLSVDYEIFGNGSGDVRQHILEPAERMVRVCERHGAPLTVFFEVEEYLAFERFERQLEIQMGYSPARLIREQISTLAARGHDIELHLHPQWVGARLENGCWLLNDDKNTVDDLFATQNEVTQYIARRKEVSESIAGKPVRVYRAGAFSAQPGAKLLRALADNQVFVDSSVVKGLRKQNGYGQMDYRAAPCAKGPWKVHTDVAQADPAGTVWEFPIYSVMRRRWHQFTWGRLRAKFSRNVPKAHQQALVRELGIGRNPIKLVRFLFQPVPIKLDFHNVAPAKLLAWIQAAPKPPAGLPDVVVLIGHTKEHVDDRPLARLLELIGREPNLEVASFGQVAEMVTAPADDIAARRVCV